MKAEREEHEQPFIPVIVTLESQEEVDKLFALCNNSAIYEAIGLKGWYEMLREFHTTAYNEYHTALSNIFKR